MLQSKIQKRFEDGGQIIIVEQEALEQEARIAQEMIAKWGMVAGVPDGEDSSGRLRLRLMTPQELVDRAFETAKLFMAYARQNNLVHIAPSLTQSLGGKDVETN